MMACDICGMSGETDRHHKMSCPNGARFQGKVTGPLSMLQEFAPTKDDDEC